MLIEMTTFCSIIVHRKVKTIKREIKFLFCLKREVSSDIVSSAVFQLSEAFALRPGD